MANHSGHILLYESDEDALARCRRLQSDLRAMIAVSKATITQSREIVAIVKSSEFHSLALANLVDEIRPH
jgi:hypothetical protein